MSYLVCDRVTDSRDEHEAHRPDSKGEHDTEALWRVLMTGRGQEGEQEDAPGEQRQHVVCHAQQQERAEPPLQTALNLQQQRHALAELHHR